MTLLHRQGVHCKVPKLAFKKYTHITDHLKPIHNIKWMLKTLLGEEEMCYCSSQSWEGFYKWLRHCIFFAWTFSTFKKNPVF